MKVFWGWVGLISLISSLCFLKFAFYSPQTQWDNPREALEAWINDFQIVEKPQGQLFVQNIEKIRAALSLIDPAGRLPQSTRYPENELRELYQASLHCENIPAALPKVLKKAWTWTAYQCKKISELPADFFQQPPYLHPSGSSFVLLAAKNRPLPWIEKRKRLTHLSELSQLKALGVKLSPIEEQIRKLSPNTLSALIHSENPIQSSDKFYILEDTHHSPRYWVYSKSDWKAFLENEGFQTVPDRSASCLARKGNLCLQFHPEHRRQQRFWLNVTLALVSLLIASLLYQLLRKMIQYRRIVRTKQLLLQLLTHELRTPVTGIHLLLEQMKKDFDQLPPSSQSHLLHLCDETQRLTRVIHASRQYLSTQEDQIQVIQPNPQRVASLNQMLQSILEPYGSKVVLSPILPDCKIASDPYWLGVCLKNLVRNALDHGKGSVCLTARQKNNSIELEIKDEGSLTQKEFHRYRKPYSQRKQSQGLGMGLHLVESILKTMNGTLSFKADPTRFLITLRGTQ